MELTYSKNTREGFKIEGYIDALTFGIGFTLGEMIWITNGISEKEIGLRLKIGTICFFIGYYRNVNKFENKLLKLQD
jgi:hypothetical protein